MRDGSRIRSSGTRPARTHQDDAVARRRPRLDSRARVARSTDSADDRYGSFCAISAMKAVRIPGVIRRRGRQIRHVRAIERGGEIQNVLGAAPRP